MGESEDRIERAAVALFEAYADPRMRWDALDDVSKESWRTAIRDEIASVGQPPLPARIASLESDLRVTDMCMQKVLADVDAKADRIAVLEGELAAARESHKRQVAHVATMFDELKHLAVEAGWDASEDLSSPMQFVRQFVRTGLVPQAGRIKEEMADLRASLAAAREECERLIGIQAALMEWAQTYGKRLCPPGADTYGEGVRDAHDQVLAILCDRARADDAGRVERVARLMQTHFGIETWGELSDASHDAWMYLATDVLAAADGNAESQRSSDEIREVLAAYAHEAWSGWMKYLFEKGDVQGGGGFTIPPWAVERWTRQMNTAYADLSEEEKASDRKEADRMLAILRGEKP